MTNRAVNSFDVCVENRKQQQEEKAKERSKVRQKLTVGRRKSEEREKDQMRC